MKLGKRARQLVPLIIVGVLSFPAVLYLIHPGFPQTDDGNWMIIRFSAFYEALRDGQFPVRWLGRLNNGYGYPVANFLYPGFMYLGIPLAVITSSFVTTIKLLFGLFMIGSSCGAYLWLRQRFSSFASTVGALVYLYTPYHLYDATVRGSLGELMALAVVPFVLWAIDKSSHLLTAGFLGVLLISHNSLAVLFLPIIICYQYLANRERNESGITSWIGIVLGVGTSIFFWLPALSDLSATVFSKVTVAQWHEYFADFSLIGIVTILVVAIAGYLLLIKRERHTPNNELIYIFTIWLLLSVILSSNISTFIWELLPVQFIQFPFRFLSLAVVSLAFVAAWIINRISRFNIYTGVVIVLITVLSGYPYLFAKEYQNHDEGFYATNMDTTTVKNEYMPIDVKEIPLEYSSEKIVTDAKATEHLKKNNRFSFTTQSSSSANVTVKQVYFPGWKAFVDNSETSLIPSDPHGFISFTVPEGEHRVDVSFTETPLRIMANSISLLSLALLLFFSIKSMRRTR